MKTKWNNFVCCRLNFGCMKGFLSAVYNML